MMTVRTLKAREHHSKLAERKRVVIFITATYVLKGGLPIYRIDRVIRETGQNFGDNNHIIYVNASHEDLESELGRLMHDFRREKDALEDITEICNMTLQQVQNLAATLKA